MTQKLICTTKCYCAKSQTVFVPFENELVCKNCGVVLGKGDDVESSQYIEQTVPYEMLSKTNLNLHQRKQVGGDPRDEQRVLSTRLYRHHHHHHRRYRNHESDQNLLAFSDVCRKLSLNNTISEDCWNAFGRDKSNLTKAKKMCHAIYQTLQNKAIPYDEKSVQQIVCSSLGVKNASGQKGIIFKANCTQAFDSQETKKRFYLNVFVQQAQQENDLSEMSTFRRNSERYLESLITSFPGTDYKTLAKKATSMAKLRCCSN